MTQTKIARCGFKADGFSRVMHRCGASERGNQSRPASAALFYVAASKKPEYKLRNFSGEHVSSPFEFLPLQSSFLTEMKFPAKGLVLLALLGISAGKESSKPEKIDDRLCPTCYVEYCPKTPQECAHGLARDECGCCKEGVCVLKEKEKCQDLKLFKNITETDMKKLSVCDEYLECVLRTDLKAGCSMSLQEVEESICKCQAVEISCGKDNATYPSICQLRQAGTELKHPGPCMTAPQIISEPEVTSPVEHERFSLNCEAKGFPVPHIYWEFEGLNGHFKLLPGDDHSTAVHSRGGPELLTVTSWVMIESLRQSDAGTYICVAKNSEGVSRAVASVHVVKRNS